MDKERKRMESTKRKEEGIKMDEMDEMDKKKNMKTEESRGRNFKGFNSDYYSNNFDEILEELINDNRLCYFYLAEYLKDDKLEMSVFMQFDNRKYLKSVQNKYCYFNIEKIEGNLSPEIMLIKNLGEITRSKELGSLTENKKFATAESFRDKGAITPGITVLKDMLMDKENGMSDRELMEKYTFDFFQYKSHLEEYCRFKENILIKERIKERYLRSELREWQKSIIRDIEHLMEEEDDRKIIWVMDVKGGAGKTYLKKYLVNVWGEDKVFDVENGKSDGLKFMYNGQKLIIFDLSKSSLEHINYGLIESMRNGYFATSKYQGKIFRVDPPPIVIVFANTGPDRSKMSEDRWEIVDISYVIGQDGKEARTEEEIRRNRMIGHTRQNEDYKANWKREDNYVDKQKQKQDMIDRARARYKDLPNIDLSAKNETRQLFKKNERIENKELKESNELTGLLYKNGQSPMKISEKQRRVPVNPFQKRANIDEEEILYSIEGHTYNVLNKKKSFLNY